MATTPAHWVRAASSTATSDAVAPFCGAKTAAAPVVPRRGLSTSAARTSRVRARRGSRPERSSRASRVRAAPPSGRSRPAASSRRAPSAASTPAPPSVLADPPTPTTTSAAPRSSAARTASPRPRLDAVRGAGTASGSRPSPQASASSTSTVGPSDGGFLPSPPATARVAVTGRPVGPCTSTGTPRHPARRAAATVPSPPSATATTVTWADGSTSSSPRRTASPTSSEDSEPLNASLATTTLGAAR